MINTIEQLRLFLIDNWDLDSCIKHLTKEPIHRDVIGIISSEYDNDVEKLVEDAFLRQGIFKAS